MTLTDEERETLYGPIGNDEAYPELPGVVADIVAARVAAVSAERDEWKEAALKFAEDYHLEVDGRADDAAELTQARTQLAAARDGLTDLAESVSGFEGVEHNEGCEGEPDCLACIVEDVYRLRAALAVPAPTDTTTEEA